MLFDMQHKKICNKEGFYQHCCLKANCSTCMSGQKLDPGHTGSGRYWLPHSGRTWWCLQDHCKFRLLCHYRSLHLLHCPRHCHLLQHFLHHRRLRHHCRCLCQHWCRNLHFWVSRVGYTKRWWLTGYILKNRAFQSIIISCFWTWNQQAINLLLYQFCSQRTGALWGF